MLKIWAGGSAAKAPYASTPLIGSSLHLPLLLSRKACKATNSHALSLRISMFMSVTLVQYNHIFVCVNLSRLCKEDQLTLTDTAICPNYDIAGSWVMSRVSWLGSLEPSMLEPHQNSEIPPIDAMAHNAKDDKDLSFLKFHDCQTES